ncbi:uncharacterized protein RJT21DRAFT_127921 [Scheffersomyces amazonensis]|uniref:uncharacterized protein n=1 Tax=Scheffersomyces amazonensis TaxID=1078765 RepID=UPI00315DE1F2
MKKSPTNRKSKLRLESSQVKTKSGNGLTEELESIFEKNVLPKSSNTQVNKNKKSRKYRKKEPFKATSTPSNSFIIEPLQSEKVDEVQRKIVLSEEINQIHFTIHKKGSPIVNDKENSAELNQYDSPEQELQLASSKHAQINGKDEKKEAKLKKPTKVKSKKVEQTERAKGPKISVQKKNKQLLRDESGLNEEKSTHPSDSSVILIPTIENKSTELDLKSKVKKKNRKVRIQRKAVAHKLQGIKKRSMSRKQLIAKEAKGADPINLLGPLKYKVILRKIL